MTNTTITECLDCGKQAIFHPAEPACPNCGSFWREAVYDYARLGPAFTSDTQSKPFDLWRYVDLLPIGTINNALTLGEGGTPLLHATNLGLMLGHSNIYIKDERQGPTASFKDRQAAVSIASLKEAGVTELVVASTGNVALAYSAFAARAGIKLWAFVTSLVPAAKMREIAIYGTQVIKVTGSYDEAKNMAAEFAHSRGLCLDLGSRSIPCIEAMKTIAFEICEQIDKIPEYSDALVFSRTKTGWKSPDWYFQSVSGGMGPLGVIKGFFELKQMGLIEVIPKMGIIQAEGCAPMVQAWKQNNMSAIPVRIPRTLIATLATGDPGRTYTELRKRMATGTGGVFESVTDDEAYRAMHILAKMEGISSEPAAAVAFAGVFKLIRSGVIKPEEIVVVNCTGHTMPVERSILGQGWDRAIDLKTTSADEKQEEGLLAALSNISLDKFPRIAIVDDEPDVRRLIRRILQSQDNYTLFEAENGRLAVDLIRQEKPDLIILDLMMPDLDGYSVMDILQQDQSTREIPIIVITAKELTLAEKQRLRGRIQALMQKGDFLSDDLLDEVKLLIK